MFAHLSTPPAGRRLAAILAALAPLAAAGFTGSAVAQQATNPGDIIIEREVTPRDAFVPVPRTDDPVAVRATTFPKSSFDPMMATLVDDTDLTNAHGSSGVAPGGLLGSSGAGMQAITRILSGSQTGSNTALGPAGVGAVGGIGGTISTSITGALAPLSSALGAAVGGMK